MVRRVIFLVLLGICISTIAAVATGSQKEQAVKTVQAD